MKVNLWYCKDMNQWRWTLTDDSRPILKQESGRESSVRIQRHCFIELQYQRLIFMFEMLQFDPVKEGLECTDRGSSAVIILKFLNIIFKCFNDHLTVLL